MNIIHHDPLLVSFEDAQEALEQGKLIRHHSWVKGKFAYKQVPNNVPNDVIPKMASVPQEVKDLLMARGIDLKFRNQINVVSPNGLATSWSYKGTDTEEEAWEIL